MTVVPRLYPGATIVCLGGGPSLTGADVDAVGITDAPVIAVNDAYRLAPWAAVLYACDGKWWSWHHGAPAFAGLKYSIDPNAGRRWPDVRVLVNTGISGLESAPTGLRTGRNSGYQAINLAVHLGAARIVLLGYDMGVGPDGRAHWFGDHPDRKPSPYHHMIAEYETLAPALAAIGVAIVNCSRRTALTCLPTGRLDDEIRLLCAARDIEDALVNGRSATVGVPVGITGATP